LLWYGAHRFESGLLNDFNGLQSASVFNYSCTVRWIGLATIIGWK